MNEQPADRRSVAIDLSDTVKTKINGIQTVQLEPGATVAKKYPAEISGNTVSILPLQSSDDNFVQVSDITPPSAELGRSSGIDLNATVKMKIHDIQTILIENKIDPSKEAHVGSRNGNQVNFCPIESGSNSVAVYTKLRQVQVNDQTVNRRSAAIDLLNQ